MFRFREELCTGVFIFPFSFLSFSTHTLQVLPMAMAQVFIPSPHDAIPSLHHHKHCSPALPTPPHSVSSLPEDEEEDQVSVLPPAPPPSPEMQQRQFGALFEIDPKKFEAPRKSELPPSPTNSLDFSTLFTPNKSPLESEPHSPTQPSPGEPLDSAYCSTHNSTSSQQSNPGSSSLSIPISPNSTTSSCYHSILSHSHSEVDPFHPGLRSQTALAQHINDNHLCMASSTLRPRSHTHPSHTHEHHHHDLQTVHPHLPISFDTTQLQSLTDTILDSGYHEESPFPRKKRKSNQLGYSNDPMDLFYNRYSESPCSSEPEWFMSQPKYNKKSCHEGENPVIRRQSASFSGVFTATSHRVTPFNDEPANTSAPPTPNHPSTPLLQDYCSLRHPSLSPPIFTHTHHFPPTPTDVPTSLQSMEIAEEGAMDTGGRLDSLDSMDCGMGDHCVEMESLSSTLRGSHLENTLLNQRNFLSTPVPSHPTNILTVSSPQPSVPPCRSYSSGDGYDFSQEPQLVQCSNIHFSSYHEGSDGAFTGNAESKFLLSKSL